MTEKEMLREAKIVRKVERFLEKSGSFLNDGYRIGLDNGGAILSEISGNPVVDRGCCILGAICWGNPVSYSHPYSLYRAAGKILGISVDDACDIERGYWYGDASPLQAIGAKIRRAYHIEDDARRVRMNIAPIAPAESSTTAALNRARALGYPLEPTE